MSKYGTEVPDPVGAKSRYVPGFGNPGCLVLKRGTCRGWVQTRYRGVDGEGEVSVDHPLTSVLSLRTEEVKV